MWTIRTYLLPVIASGIVLIASCKKDDTDPTDPVPVITFESVTPATVQEYTDSLVFTISYADGDGDLGENDADVKNLFLTDVRNQVTYEYRIRQLAPTGANIPIQGNLNIVLDHTAILDGSTSETAAFEIYVVDRAGNVSNTVTSSLVQVVQ